MIKKNSFIGVQHNMENSNIDQTSNSLIYLIILYHVAKGEKLVIFYMCICKSISYTFIGRKEVL